MTGEVRVYAAKFEGGAARAKESIYTNDGRARVLREPIGDWGIAEANLRRSVILLLGRSSGCPREGIVSRR